MTALDALCLDAASRGEVVVVGSAPACAPAPPFAARVLAELRLQGMTTVAAIARELHLPAADVRTVLLAAASSPGGTDVVAIADEPDRFAIRACLRAVNATLARWRHVAAKDAAYRASLD